MADERRNVWIQFLHNARENEPKALRAIGAATCAAAVRAAAASPPVVEWDIGARARRPECRPFVGVGRGVGAALARGDGGR